jgi:hypothetical protein
MITVDLKSNNLYIRCYYLFDDVWKCRFKEY